MFIAFSSAFILAKEFLILIDSVVSSSLLQWSAFLYMAFLNSFSTFITFCLNSGSSRLERAFIVCSFRVFLLVFYLGVVFCFFILLIFLRLCKFMGNSYLLWPWSVVFMWEYPYITFLSLTFLVWGMFLVSLPATFFMFPHVKG